MADKVKIGLIQMTSAGEAAGNLEKAVAAIDSAAAKGAQIIALQELFRSDYFCQSEDPDNFKLAETLPGPTTEVLSEIAKEKSVVIIAPIFEKRTEGIYHNSAVVIDADGTIAGKYRKMHIPDDPNFYEKFYFTPGDLGFKAHNTKYGKIAVLICWDQWFPEAARLAALEGAQILFYPTAIGWHDSELPDVKRAQLAGWEIVQRGHAVANGVYVAVTNRVGKEGELTFWGRSFVADPFGGIIEQASEDAEQTLIVSCDLAKIGELRQGWPFLRDRRIDAYGPITSRFLG
ncbi:MAG: carbon-nitrogen hydrolase [Candidatus Omnitrophota bacterium]|nr:carbon-nitrogen hydrolase [Candidatus Omnitrophota bacterium]